MRMLDLQRKQSVRTLQLYLTADEAREMQQELGQLLTDPEAYEHFHVYSHESNHEISCSIVTRRKLEEGTYTAIERTVLEER
jgi:hypothetical protein